MVADLRQGDCKLSHQGSLFFVLNTNKRSYIIASGGIKLGEITKQQVARQPTNHVWSVRKLRLFDIERKVLRIIINSTFYGNVPTIKQLMSWTGRRQNEVFVVLRSLNRKGYIEWSAERPEKIKLLRKEHRLSGC